jgi:hypothetical protein
MFAMNAVSPKKNSAFVKTGACCRIARNAHFSCSSMVPAAEIYEYIISAAPVTRNESKEGLLNPRKEVEATFRNKPAQQNLFINLKGGLHGYRQEDDAQGSSCKIHP